MPIQGFLTDRILDSSVTDRVSGGEKADWLWGGLGNIMGIDSEGIVDDAYKTGQKTKAGKVVAGSGFSESELSKYGDLSTPEGVQGAVSGATRARNLSDTSTQHTQGIERAMAPVNAGLQSQAQQLQAQLQQSGQQFQVQMEQLRNDRADSKDARADELEYRRMQDRKEDLRYNENIDRMDRKDRQASINTLVQGLTALGAAFAA
jgi:hypothetical protein